MTNADVELRQRLSLIYGIKPTLIYGDKIKHMEAVTALAAHAARELRGKPHIQLCQGQLL